MPHLPQHIAIVGGGLTGLSVGLACAKAGRRVTLLEASQRLGGQIHTEVVSAVEWQQLSGEIVDGPFVIEWGAEGFVANSVATASLAQAVGVESALVGQSSNLSFGFDGVTLRELAPGEAARLLGFQVANSELGRGIRSLQLGTGQLISALVGQVSASAELRLGTRVLSLENDAEPRADRRKRLQTSNGVMACDALVVATEARPAAEILAPLFGEQAATLSNAITASSVNVSLVYPEAALPQLRGTGFVVITKDDQQGLRACSYASLKLPGRTPRGYVMLRAFFRPQDTELVDCSDADWLARAENALRKALGVDQTPRLSRVARWQNALPVHSPAFREAVQRLEAPLNAQGVYLAGSAFHGSGIDAALRSADVAIRALCGENPLFSVQ